MYQGNSKSVSQYLFLVAMPISLLVAQAFHFSIAIVLVSALFIISFSCKVVRKEAFLIAMLISGYLSWMLANHYIQALCEYNSILNEVTVILSRFGLIGYLILFTIWYFINKTNENYFRIGNLHANIKIPFIWYGFNDNVLRVSVVFSLVCVAVAGVFTVINQLSFGLVWMGLTFSLVNAVLEELLWRGFILNRLTDLFSEKISLIMMSLTFGVYHYSLGFSLPICLLFSLGGIYFGGITMKSKGLLMATIMHFCMNMIFVSIGIIFQ